MKNFFKKTLAVILRLLSQVVLMKYRPKIIAITGSVGKTSTKDAVYAVLAKTTHVRKSDKSYNSEIGLPLTILGVTNGWNNPFIWTKNIFKGLWLILGPHKYPKWLVLEVGVGKPGDMKKTAAWLKTDAVIITGMGEMPPHIEFFESLKHLVDEKAGLVKTLKKDGILILNADDPAALSMKDKTKNLTYTYGFTPGADFLASEDNILYGAGSTPEGVVFRVDIDGKSLPVTIEGVFGRNHIYASLAALGFCHSFKFGTLEAIEALKDYEVPPGRMRLLEGQGESLIIDDTYNSSPLACMAALATLGLVVTKGRKIAVLGDMLELGKHTEEAHKSIGALVYEHADILVVVGPRARAFKEGALEAGMKEASIFEFSNSNEAADFIKGMLKKGDFFLIKGSQGVRMERVVSAIVLDQNNKWKLLVRQDKEWQKRK